MLSGGELLLIFIVALLVFGPERLPELGRAVGKFMHQIRSGMQDINAEMQKEMHEMEKQQNKVALSSKQENPKDKVELSSKQENLEDKVDHTDIYDKQE
jgi:Tat protein translocase TatB subunit